MLETIGLIVIKYWVEFALGLIAAGAGFFIKRYVKLEKESRAKEQKEFFNNLTQGIKDETKALTESLLFKYEELDDIVDERCENLTLQVHEALEEEEKISKQEDAVLQKQIIDLNGQVEALKAGMLSMQGKEFRASCRKLLEEGHEITLDEWEELDADHEAYNGLGGNHKGDHLYSLVKKKVENTLADGK